MEKPKNDSGKENNKSPMLVPLVLILITVIIGGIKYSNDLENVDLSAGARASQVSNNVSLSLPQNKIGNLPPNISYLPGCNSYVGFSVTTGLPCWFETKNATNIGSTWAVLNANLLSGAPQSFYFDYVTNGMPSSISTPFIINQNNGSFSSKIQGLSPNTSYNFMVCTGTVTVSCGAWLSFVTLP